MNELNSNIETIKTLCLHHKVKSLYAFGSILTGAFNNKSDIDLIVDFNNMNVEEYADNYFDFKFALQDVFHRPIDLLEEKAIKNPFFKESVNLKKVLIYGN